MDKNYKLSIQDLQELLEKFNELELKKIKPKEKTLPIKLGECSICGQRINQKGICFCNDIYSDR